MATICTPDGAEGVTFGQQHSSTRTTESGSTILAVSAHARTPQRHRQDEPKSQNMGVTFTMHRTVMDPPRRTGPDTTVEPTKREEASQL